MLDMKTLYEQITAYYECIHTESDASETTETFTDVDNPSITITVDWYNDRIKSINFFNNTIDIDNDM